MKKGAWKTSTAELISYITKSPLRKSIRRFTRNKKDSSINSTTLTLMLYCWQHWNILRLTTLKYSPIDHNLISNLETMGFNYDWDIWETLFCNSASNNGCWLDSYYVCWKVRKCVPSKAILKKTNFKHWQILQRGERKEMVLTMDKLVEMRRMYHN